MLPVKTNIESPVQNDMQVAQLNGRLLFIHPNNLLRDLRPNSVSRVNKVNLTFVSQIHTQLTAASKYPIVSIVQKLI